MNREGDAFAICPGYKLDTEADPLYANWEHICDGSTSYFVDENGYNRWVYCGDYAAKDYAEDFTAPAQMIYSVVMIFYR